MARFAVDVTEAALCEADGVGDFTRRLVGCISTRTNCTAGWFGIGRIRFAARQHHEFGLAVLWHDQARYAPSYDNATAQSRFTSGRHAASWVMHG